LFVSNILCSWSVSASIQAHKTVYILLATANLLELSAKEKSFQVPKVAGFPTDWTAYLGDLPNEGPKDRLPGNCLGNAQKKASVSAGFHAVVQNDIAISSVRTVC
jgi:hypothetical protein